MADSIVGGFFSCIAKQYGRGIIGVDVGEGRVAVIVVHCGLCNSSLEVSCDSDAASYPSKRLFYQFY